MQDLHSEPCEGDACYAALLHSLEHCALRSGSFHRDFDVCRASRAVAMIATNLAKRVTSDAESATPPNPSLATGDAGHALLFASALMSSKKNEFARAARMSAFGAMACAQSQVLSAGLFEGVTGVCWVIDHIPSILPYEVRSSFREGYDKAMRTHLLTTDGRRYDLATGLAGVLLYYHARRGPVAREAIERAVALLRRGMCADELGCYWPVPPEAIHNARMAQYPGGFCPTGMATGLAGLIIALSKTYNAHGPVPYVRELLQAAIESLMARRLPPNCKSAFPAIIAPGVQSKPSRCSWGHGDTGIALALQCGGRSLASDQYIEASRETIARAAKQLAYGTSGVMDASIYQGSAGLALSFLRLYQVSGDRDACQAAQYWYDKVVAQYDPKDPGYGYRCFDSGDFTISTGLLTGWAGVALALMAALGCALPNWDCALGMPATDDEQRECMKWPHS